MDEELIDEDDLLDDNDILKPDTNLRGKTEPPIFYNNSSNNINLIRKLISAAFYFSMQHDWQTKSMQRLFLWLG